VLGGVFGWGLKRNVIHLYQFICRHYQPGAEIYGFGFSRGAFTIRVLMGVIASQGVVKFDSEEELNWKAVQAFQAYRVEKYNRNRLTLIEPPVRLFRWIFAKVFRREIYDKNKNDEVPAIHFLGLWDTVAAYGLPIEEMTRGISLFLWPLELPDRKLSTEVTRACHALALDDERTTFHPVLWTEEDERVVTNTNGPASIRDERISQVWFVGAHANVGGGYPDDKLAHVALNWILNEAKASGLRLKEAPAADPDALVHISSSQDKDGRLYDSRSGLGGYYRYGPRDVTELCDQKFSARKFDSVRIGLPKIHVSAIERLSNGAHAYAPISFPQSYAVVEEDGRIVPSPETPAQATQRAQHQPLVWNLVWWRRIIYFATLAATFHLILFPLIYQVDKAAEFSSPWRPVSELLRLASTVLPSLAWWWLGAFAARGMEFVIGATVLGLLLWYGAKIGRRVISRMSLVWNEKPPLRGKIRSSIHAVILSLREWSVYKGIKTVGKRFLLPFASAFAIVCLPVMLLSHLFFNIFDASGFHCRESEKPYNLRPNEEREIAFGTSSFCAGTGIYLEQGYRYSITITETAPWFDGIYESGVTGFELSELPDWTSRVSMWAKQPLRRVFLRPWFRPVARIGSTGNDEYFIDPEERSGLWDPQNQKVSSVFTTSEAVSCFYMSTTRQ
jgi:type VI secretion system (T6SS) phospholipase Tle1-like effector